MPIKISLEKIFIVFQKLFFNLRKEKPPWLMNEYKIKIIPNNVLADILQQTIYRSFYLTEINLSQGEVGV